MPNENEIGYGIIGLTKDQANSLASSYQENNQTPDNKTLGKELKAILDNYHKDDVNLWKPFGAHTIGEILKVNNKNYKDKSTVIIDIIEGTPTDICKFHKSNIRVLLIDAFAALLDDYKKLVLRSDLFLSSSVNCCFILNDDLSQSTKKILRNNIETCWPAVCESRRFGWKHRIESFPIEVDNFVRDGFVKPSLEGVNAKTGVAACKVMDPSGSNTGRSLPVTTGGS